MVRKPPESGLLHPQGTRTPCKNVFDKKQTNKEGRKIMSKLYSLSAMVSVKDLDPMGKMQDFNSE